jgi:hypothetical protein
MERPRPIARRGPGRRGERVGGAAAAGPRLARVRWPAVAWATARVARGRRPRGGRDWRRGTPPLQPGRPLRGIPGPVVSSRTPAPATRRSAAIATIPRRAPEIKVRAERGAGDLLAAMPKNEGTKGMLTGDVHVGGHVIGPPTDSTRTLHDLGISKNQSAQWQEVARVPEPVFEAAVIREAEARMQKKAPVYAETGAGTNWEESPSHAPRPIRLVGLRGPAAWRAGERSRPG